MSYKKLALYCKTYRRDIPKVVNLLESIEKHNKDKIPVYVSCPIADIPLLQKEIVGKDVNVFADEKAFFPSKTIEGWEHQMLVKLHVFKQVPAHNVLLVDSDVFFIRDFYESDFIAYDNIPYTIIHENIQVAEYEAYLKGGDYSKTGYAKAVKAYRDLFGGRSNRIYDYGPNPHLWNREVLDHFFTNYLDYHGLTMEQFQYGLARQYKVHFRETLTYGEYLLATRIIPIVPCGPLFKCYHWKEMYDFEAQVGMVNVDIHKKVYLGVVLQSNWT